MEKEIVKKYLIVLIGFSGIFGILGYLNINLEFYVWEFLVDLKISAIFAAIAYIFYRNGVKISVKDLGLQSFNWKFSLLFFFLPLVCSLIILIIGFLSGMAIYANPDNPSTQLLGVIFDIPAICFFSVTTILLEEVVFRAGLIKIFSNHISRIRLVAVSTLLWGMYSIPRLFVSEEITFFSIVSMLFFWISIGYFCTRLYILSNSVWIVYFFRVGILIFLPLVLGDFAADMDPFFEVKSKLFISDGIFTALFLLISPSFLRFFLKKPHILTPQK